MTQKTATILPRTRFWLSLAIFTTAISPANAQEGDDSTETGDDEEESLDTYTDEEFDEAFDDSNDAQGIDGEDSAYEQYANETAPRAASSNMPTPWPVDSTRNYKVHRLTYNCGSRWCNATDGVLGTGGKHLRAIPSGNRTRIFMAFPNNGEAFGHVEDPETIVFLTTGQQADAEGDASSVTGQKSKFKQKIQREMLASASGSFSGDSLLGRLKRQLPSTRTEFIVNLDNSAVAFDVNYDDIYRAFARYIADKANASSRIKRIIMAGHSRGGFLVANATKYIRDQGLIDDDIAIYTVNADPVAGDQTDFGVDPNDSKHSPFDWDHRVEQTDIFRQLDDEDREDKTFFYNIMTGRRVITERGFGAKTEAQGRSMLTPNYWNETWTTLDHGDLVSYDNNKPATTWDPVLSWYFGMEANVRRDRIGLWPKSTVKVTGSKRKVVYMDLDEGYSYFRATWNSGHRADLDVKIYDPSGTQLCRGTSTSTYKETVNCDIPSRGTYRAEIYSYKGSSDVKWSWAGDLRRDQTGRFELPNEKIGSITAHRRTYELLTDSDGSGAINLLLEWDDDEADLDVVLLDPDGHQVASSNSTTMGEHISYKFRDRGRYIVEVKSYNKKPANFHLVGWAPLWDSNYTP